MFIDEFSLECGQHCSVKSQKLAQSLSNSLNLELLVSLGFLQQIKRDLRLTTGQFEDLVNCPLDAEEFAHIIRKQVG